MLESRLRAICPTRIKLRELVQRELPKQLKKIPPIINESLMSAFNLDLSLIVRSAVVIGIGSFALLVTVKGLGCARLTGGHLSPSTKVVKSRKGTRFTSPGHNLNPVLVAANLSRSHFAFEKLE